MNEMDSKSGWGSGGGGRGGRGSDGIWGDPAGDLGVDSSSIWSDGSGRRSTTSVGTWPGLETDSKPDSSGWGSLPLEGSGCAPGESCNGASGDADPWGCSLGHGSSSSWGSAGSVSDHREAAGWGSIHASPMPNPGAEGLGFCAEKEQRRRGARETENRSDFVTSSTTDRPTTLDEKMNPSRTPTLNDQQSHSHWENPISSVSVSVSVPSRNDEGRSGELNPAGVAVSSVLVPAPDASGRSTSVERKERGASAPGGGGGAGDSTREELMFRAINSTEGWGKTPIRQDTAWNTDDEIKKPMMMMSKSDDMTCDLIGQNANGTWQLNRELQSSWSGRASELPGGGLDGLGGLCPGAPKADLGLSLAAGKHNVFPTTDEQSEHGKENSWGGAEKPDFSWESGDVGLANRKGGSEPEMWGGQLRPRTRSSLASNDDGDDRGWTDPNLDSRGTALVDGGTGLWSNSGDQPGLKPSFPPANVNGPFSVPPPQFGADGFGGVPGPWNSSSGQQMKSGDMWGDGQWPTGSGIDTRRPSAGSSMGDWNASNNSRRGLTAGMFDNVRSSHHHPQMRSQLLQQLMDMGFKKEDAHSALISNNMNFESALSKLIVTQGQGQGHGGSGAGRLDLDHDFPGRRIVHPSLSSPGRLDPSTPDVSAGLYNFLQNGAGANTLGSLHQQQRINSMGGGGGVSPPQCFTPNGVGPGLLSSLPPNLVMLLQQKLLQSGAAARPDGSSQAAMQLSALQQQLLQQQLMQNVQSAVQAGLVHPNLITPRSLTPTVLVKLQQLMEMYQAHQMLMQESARQQQQPQRPQQSAGIDATLTSFKQLIVHAQEQVLQELALLQAPAPPPPAVLAGHDTMDQLLKNFAGMHARDEVASPHGNQNLQHSVSLPARSNAIDVAESPWSSANPTWNHGVRPENVVSGSNDGSASGGVLAASATTVPALIGAVPQLDIAEFVPGRPWQGLTTKGGEDDSSSVSDAANTSSGVATSSVAVGNVLGAGSSSSSSFSVSGSSNLSSRPSPWSSSSSSSESPLTTADPWAAAGSQTATHPYQSRMQHQPPLQPNRSNSWTPVQMNSLNLLPSNWLRLRNISPQIDNTTLQALCQQHGALECFVPNRARDDVIVKFVRIEDACRAERSLDALPIAGVRLTAEFLDQTQVIQILQQGQGQGVAQSQPSRSIVGGNTHQFAGLGEKGGSGGPAPGAFGCGSGFGGGGGIGGHWGNVGAEDHGLYLQNNKHF